MKHLFVLSILISFSFVYKSDDPPGALDGTWIVDLTPSPKSEKYTQEMTLKAANRVMLKGTFYGSEIEDSEINHHWPNLHIGFRTSDASHDYYHTAYLKNDTLFGTTFCPGRGLLQPWTAVKKTDD